MSFTRNAFIAASGAACSRLLGFARDAAMAWLLGCGPVADALSVALRVPYIVRRMLGEGTLSLPITVACTRADGAQRNALALAVGRRLAWIAWPVCIAAVMFAQPLVAVLAPGFDLQLAALACTLLVPGVLYVGFALSASAYIGALHASDRFAIPGLMPSVFNIMVLFVCGVSAWRGYTDVWTAHAIAASVLAGGATQWLLLRVAVGRMPDEPTLPAQCFEASAEVWRVVRALPTGIFGAAVPQLIFLLAGVAASLAPTGHIAALFYAERLLEFPLGLFGAALGMACAPLLARQANAVQRGEVLRRTLVLAWCLNLPAAAGLCALAIPIVDVLFGHGEFDATAVQLTGHAVAIYALALPAYGLSRPLLSACYAAGDAGLAWRAWLAMGVAGCTSWLCAVGIVWGAASPAWGVCLGLWMYTFLLYGRIWQTTIPHALRFSASEIYLLGMACVGSLVTYAAALGTATLSKAHEMPAGVALALAICAGMVGYAALMLPLRRQFVGLFRALQLSNC